MYGNNECGICKTPYVGPPPDLIDGSDSEDDSEEEELTPPPCICYLFPTPVRAHTWETTEYDKICDIFRYSILASIIVFTYNTVTDIPHTEIVSDLVPSFTIFMVLMCCCSTLGQKLGRRTRNLRQRRYRGPAAV